ncbi:MAG TPA: MBOAT family O-acyltransferase [Oligoflexia bacterium]|nr:MBOAT family O-acyltransferase [Oligoflexia bacterium]HMP48113.1 MBOAT family O-acyltransferase [Oligoflexia bacterium]
MSLFFYAWGVPKLVGVLVLSSVIDFWLSNQFPKYPAGMRKKNLFVVSIFLNVSLLLYFKYSNFILSEVNLLLSVMSIEAIPWKEVLLPIGISFFTFQKISYLADVYQNKVKPADNLISYLLFVALFPQLIAGPIVKYHDINEQLEKRSHSIDLFFEGFIRFALGLGKKVLIADAMGAVADNVYNLDPSQRTVLYSWLGTICYSMQIYYDFSGYSDMAIGLGKMFGFRLLENFNFPYISQNLTEFWRRWHISLSTWMKEYLYIALGGKNCSNLRRYINLWIVFLVSGLWHGASWNFILWGMFHGFFLTLDKLFWLDFSKKLPRFFNILITYFIVLNSWVLFRSETLEKAASMYSSLYGLGSGLGQINLTYLDQVINNRGLTVLVLVMIFYIFSATKSFNKLFGHMESRRNSLPVYFSKGLISIVVYIVSVLALSSVNYNPFIYFKF